MQLNKETLRGLGAHAGYSKTRRHPSVAKFLEEGTGFKDKIDLDKTLEQLSVAQNFLKNNQEKKILLIGTKPEIHRIVAEIADEAGTYFVERRWIGGTLTNFPEIKKRLDRLNDLTERRDSGKLVYKTKKERVMQEQEIAKLSSKFDGIKAMQATPDIILIVDPRHEHIAATEARQKKIPIIAIMNTDCDMSAIDYPILANDASVDSVKIILKELMNQN